MNIKDIAVLIDHSLGARNRIEVAVSLAEQSQAALTGVYAYATAERYLYSYSGMPAPQTAIEEFERKIEAQKVSAQQQFEKLTTSGNVINKFIAKAGYQVDIFGDIARYTDVGVISQPGDYAKEDFPRQLANGILLETGVPILCVPKAGWTQPIGRNVVVAWKNSREGARALTNAIHLMDRNARVSVVSLDDSKDVAYQDAILCCERLSHHGIEATPHGLHTSKHREGELIVEFCDQDRSDLLVMGAWGHTRIREAILGGATNSVLQLMTVPVLFSH